MCHRDGPPLFNFGTSIGRRATAATNLLPRSIFSRASRPNWQTSQQKSGRPPLLRSFERRLLDRFISYGDDEVGEIEQPIGRLVGKLANPAAEVPAGCSC